MNSKVGLEEARQCKSCGTTLTPKPVRDVVQSTGHGGARKGAGQKPRYCASCSGRQGHGHRRVTCRPCVGCKQPSATRTCATCQAEKVAARRESRPCAACGKVFQCTKASPKKACGSKCGNALAVQAAKDKVILRTCEHCGTSFKKKGSKDAGRFCGRPCAFAWVAERARARVVAPKLKVPLHGACAGCNGTFVKRAANQRWCSNACQSSAVKNARKRPPRPATCQECGVVFQATNRGPARICSDACRQRARVRWARSGRQAPAYRRHKRIEKARRRARMRQATCEPVDPLYIFKRDGWRCQLCGVKTPARLRGQMVDAAPEMDHIVPLAQGGAHTHENAQCLCRKCNGRKGATALGQMRLCG